MNVFKTMLFSTVSIVSASGCMDLASDSGDSVQDAQDNIQTTTASFHEREAAILNASGTGCSQNSCNGLDPTLSFNQSSGAGCSSGARNVSDLPNGEPALGGLLELRFGPNCTTNWTRFTPGNNDKYQIMVARLSDSEWAGTGLENFYTFSGAKGIAHFSDQIYSPGAAMACVSDITTGGNGICFQQ